MLAIAGEEKKNQYFDSLKSSVIKDNGNWLSMGDNEGFQDNADPESKNSLGKWKDNYMDVIYHLIKEDNEYSLILEFNDSSYYKKNVEFEIEQRLYKFSLSNSPSGEYYLLKEGYLEAGDDKGFIDKYEIIS